MYVLAEQLIELGVSRSALKRKINTGEWRAIGVTRKRNGKFDCHVLLASLPLEHQVEFLRHKAGVDSAGNNTALLDLSDPAINEQEKVIRASLLRIPLEERSAWISEAIRLAKIVALYESIKPKRKLDPDTLKYRFVSEVLKLCREAACTSPVIIVREPHRADPPAPHTLDGWLRKYRVDGLLCFIRNAPAINSNKPDGRHPVMSREAQEWVTANWRRFRSARYLFNELEQSAKEKGWIIPSYSWFYRLWKRMPKIVKTFHLDGGSVYTAKYAPFVPRDYSDLQALQVLCGDHSERDVTVLYNDGTLVRPWLTLWLDLRTWLIWGWHLDVVPSSYTVGMAYADGVRNFGAQPPSRPDNEVFSFVYTDHGRPYISHHWDGTVIAVHEEAMNIHGGLELLLVQRKVGILEDFQVRHLVANLQNAKEKPVERVHRDISDWEENTFLEFCGRDAKTRPDSWRKSYAQHLQFQKGKRESSPFGSFEQYREQLALFITRHNSSAHQRSTLGGRSIVPTDEYKRLYTTHYEVSVETLALLVMKTVKRVIGKDGVQCFQKNWFYYHEAMAEFKGQSVETRYDDDDYSRVWVILPNKEICEASLIQPTSLINPNQRTLKAVKDARAHERKLIREYHLLSESQFRGETTEERVMKNLQPETSGIQPEQPLSSGQVHRLTRFDRAKLVALSAPSEVSKSEISECQIDDTMFPPDEAGRLNSFDDEEEE